MILELIKFEIKQFYFCSKLPQILSLSSMLIIIIFTLMQDPEISAQTTPILLIIWQSLTLVNYSYHIFKKDYDDGNLEIQLSLMNIDKFFMSKFFALVLIFFLSNFFVNFVIILFFNIDKVKIYAIFGCGIIGSFCAPAVSMLFSSMESYFENSSLMQIIIIPFLIPYLIFSGIFLSNPTIEIFFIMIGITMIITPVCLFLNNFLLKNIYNY